MNCDTVRFCLGLLCLALFVLSGCERSGTGPATETGGLPMRQVASQDLPAFMDSLDFDGLGHALDQSLAYFKRVPEERSYAYGKERFSAGHMIRSLETLKSFLATFPATSELNTFIRKNYRVFESAANRDGQVLFTGYYEPTYQGSLTRTPPFIHPLYTLPSDLMEIDLSLFSDDYKGHKRLKARVDGNRVVPYYSRGEINGTPDFGDRAKVLLYLQNRVDRFFLEVQGSGRIRLPDDSIVRVHYAGSNGNPYRSVGRYLIRKGEVKKEDMSMQAIRNWLEKNPHRMDEVLHYNKSFVFFREETGGPYGCINVELTPFRSIATDRKLFPDGALCFIRTALPGRGDTTSPDQWAQQSFFVMNQDTGGAIRGPGRADLFCGSDDHAEFTAGHMNVRGTLYFLVLKP